METKKYDIGYTTGVFDLFHIGHLNIIKRAKDLCNVLIVGVNTDELVMEYKGHNPVISFPERIAIVEAIRYVDMAVAQKSLDKLIAWGELKFNVLVQGEDWKGTQRYIETEKQLNDVGVDVKFLPVTPGVTSTQLTKFIKESIDIT
jgi:glycerol-3-phosphate cytidylyltransferase